jgi:hypothetical protein
MGLGTLFLEALSTGMITRSEMNWGLPSKILLTELRRRQHNALAD